MRIVDSLKDMFAYFQTRRNIIEKRKFDAEAKDAEARRKQQAEEAAKKKKKELEAQKKYVSFLSSPSPLLFFFFFFFLLLFAFCVKLTFVLGQTEKRPLLPRSARKPQRRLRPLKKLSIFSSHLSLILKLLLLFLIQLYVPRRKTE